MERLPALSDSLFSCAQHPEVIDCLRGHSTVSTLKMINTQLQSHYNSPTVLPIDLDIEEHLMSNNRALLLIVNTGEHITFFLSLPRAKTAAKHSISKKKFITNKHGKLVRLENS